MGERLSMFARVRPCANCPFRKGVGSSYQLTPGRLEGIRLAPAFQCHKSVDYSGEAERQGSHPVQCAGLMAVMHNEGTPNQMMQVATRMGHLDPRELDPQGEAYASWDDVCDAHAGAEP